MSLQEQSKKHGSALDKSLAVLEEIAASTAPMTLPELTQRLGQPRQTLHRILLQLEQAHLIVRDPSRDQFSIGPRLSRLSLNALLSHNQAAPIRALLQELVEEIGETCNIGVLDGLDFIYLERIESDWPLRVHLQAGSRVPAYCTSGGKVLLANLPSRQRRRLLTSRNLIAQTDNTVTDPDVLGAELKSAKKSGYAVNNEENSRGIIGIAVPIFNASGDAVAALACHAPSARISLEELRQTVPALSQKAQELSAIWYED